MYNNAKSNIINYMLGVSLNLVDIPRSELKGVTIDDLARFIFYKVYMQNTPVVVLEPKPGVNVTPLQCSKISLRLSKSLGCAIAFKFTKLEYYERIRLLQKNVYFITVDNNIHLPNLVLTSQTPKKVAKKLSRAAQYLILHHLQKDNLEDKSISEVAEIVPYSYVSVAKAVEVLEDLGLCECEKDSGRNKRLHFPKYGREYWDYVRRYLMSPVMKVSYCDAILNMQCPKAGISALAEYSNLAPDNQKTVAVYAPDFKNLQFEGLNDFDGFIEVQVWKYRPIVLEDGIVDKLSLYLSLDGDNDPRVEKEINNMIEGVWKGMN